MKKLNEQNAEQQTKGVDEISRRNFMHKMVSFFGVTTAAAVMSGCSVSVAKQFAVQRPNPPKNGTLFSEHELTVLYSLCETILPRTDTPSAVEVGCHEFVPHQLQHCHSEKQQEDCINIINTVDRYADKKWGKSFPLLTPQHQQQLLTKIEVDDKTSNIQKEQFSFLKALIVFGYFTSEVGATQALNYQAVPGGFTGSIPANSDTKSWGSLAYY